MERLLADGVRVSLFNRGQTNPDLFGSVPRLVGDRDGDVSALAGGDCDVVYDLSGFKPAHIERVAW